MSTARTIKEHKDSERAYWKRERSPTSRKLKRQRTLEEIEEYQKEQEAKDEKFMDVLYPEDPDELNVIQMRVNDAMKLNIKNESTIGIRDLRLAFYRDGEDSLGNDNGRFEKLQFIGTPVVVLEIYDPDE